MALKIILLVITAVFFVSCGQNEPPTEEVRQLTPTATPVVLPTPTAAPTPEPMEDHTGQAIDPLTGNWIGEDAAIRRPVAVVINNHHKALPQSGLSQAAVLYEVLAEGDITRIVGIFHAFDSAKIGPVRSTRDYFIDFALDYDSIFVHHGGSDSGYDAIANLRVPHLDGMALEGITFWRDPVRVKIKGMMEHSSYTDAVHLNEAIEKHGFRNTLTEDVKIGFNFYPEITATQGQRAEKVIVPFSSTYVASFLYDGGAYFKYHEDEAQIDEETGEQLSVTNVLIQVTDISGKPNDAYGRRDVGTVGEGSGFLITQGNAESITWKKASHTDPTEWYSASGAVLQFNRGKTWICIVSSKTNITIE